MAIETSKDDLEMGAPKGKSVVVPVVRDGAYRQYSAERFSMVRTAPPPLAKYELRLQSLVHRELSQQLNLVPGSGLGIVGREMRMEIIELAAIEITLPQMIKLRDEFSAAITDAAPRSESAAREQLMELTAQIDVAETELARQASQSRGQEANTADRRDIATLSARVDVLSELLVKRVERSDAGAPGQLAWALSDPLPVQLPNRINAGRGSVLAGVLGLLLLVGGFGSLAWLTAPALLHGQAPASGLVVASSVPPAAPALVIPPAVPALVVSSAAPILPARKAADAGPVNLPPPGPPPAPRQAPPPTVAEAPPAPAEPAADPIPPPAAPETSAVRLADALPAMASLPALALAEPSAPPQPAPAAAPAVPPEAASPSAVKEPEAKPHPPHMVVGARSDSWVSVQDTHGRIYVARVLKAGEGWAVPPVGGLRLTTGNAGSTFLIVDGVARPPLGAEHGVWSGTLAQ